MSPGKKAVSGQQPRRVARKSLDKLGPRRSLPARNAKSAYSRTANPVPAAANVGPPPRVQNAGPSAIIPKTPRAPVKTNLQREAELGITCIRCENTGRVAITTLAGKKIGSFRSCKYTSTPAELVAMQREAEAKCPAAFTKKVILDSHTPDTSDGQARKLPHSTNAPSTAMQVDQEAEQPPTDTQRADNVNLITESKWNNILQQVEYLKRDSKANEKRLTELEAFMQALRRENRELKNADAEKAPQAQRKMSTA